MGRESGKRSPIGERLRDLRTDFARKEDFSERLGISLSSVGRYLRGERLPDAKFLLALRTKLGVNPTWVLTGEGSKLLEEPAERPSSAPTRRDLATQLVEGREARKLRVVIEGIEHSEDPLAFCLVPVLSTHVSAGPDRLAIAEHVVALTAYRRESLPRSVRDEKQLCEVAVTGEAMVPELRDGDAVLIQRTENSLQGEAMYVVRLRDSLLIRYLQPLPGGRIQVTSENCVAFPSFIIEPASIVSGECEIVGRVVRQIRDR